ncbi:hypothetical protein XdyCFBP7245_16535 [Xanthomonas dyei]|uniref:Uncharacterized protein n=1 Tax=Xanthomonas dyei TaxID=743699 RepID=A0A2S7BZM1_9XANT|nr:hypothetical protein XdyCFBP7245_16535 [Xanthomonas dyei]
MVRAAHYVCGAYEMRCQLYASLRQRLSNAITQSPASASAFATRCDQLFHTSTDHRSGAVSSPLAVPLAAWMPPSSPQGWVHGVSRERRGHRARDTAVLLWLSIAPRQNNASQARLHKYSRR